MLYKFSCDFQAKKRSNFLLRRLSWVEWSLNEIQIKLHEKSTYQKKEKSNLFRDLQADNVKNVSTWCKWTISQHSPLICILRPYPQLKKQFTNHSRRQWRLSLIQFNTNCLNEACESHLTLSEFTCWFVNTTSLQAHQKNIQIEFIHDLCTSNDKQVFSSNSNPIQNDSFSWQAFGSLPKAGLLFPHTRSQVSSALLWYQAFRYAIHHRKFSGEGNSLIALFHFSHRCLSTQIE